MSFLSPPPLFFPYRNKFCPNALYIVNVPKLAPKRFAELWQSLTRTYQPKFDAYFIHDWQFHFDFRSRFSRSRFPLSSVSPSLVSLSSLRRVGLAMRKCVRALRLFYLQLRESLLVIVINDVGTSFLCAPAGHSTGSPQLVFNRHWSIVNQAPFIR